MRLADVKRSPVLRRLVADHDARARIAAALELAGLATLEAELELRPWQDGAEIEGRWRAQATQTCGVTLDPFDVDLEGRLHVRCLPPQAALPPTPGGELVVDLEAEDPPDILDDGAIDLGAYVVEHLALELDPFPRKPGAAFEPPAVEAPVSPFAVLTRLKRAADDGSDR